MPSKMIQNDYDTFIALGGNLPFEGQTPAFTLQNAVLQLQNRGLAIRAVSRFYETPCFPVNSGPDYVNAVVAVKAEKTPDQLLELLHEVEQFFGRARDTRWGMRTLDLDLIAMGRVVLPDAQRQQDWRDLPLETQKIRAPEQLILPHPRLQDRGFVLVPLCDVAPGWVHPLLGLAAREMRARLPAEDISSIHPL